MYNVFVNGIKVNSKPVPFVIASVIANWHRQYQKIEVKKA
jgi:hypothetical protein